MSSTSERRAERLLAAMHKVFSHDLPNQLVVIQSLLGLLGDEASRLSDEGRDMLRRIGAAAGRAGDMVYFLKDMARQAGEVDLLHRLGQAGARSAGGAGAPLSAPRLAAANYLASGLGG